LKTFTAGIALAVVVTPVVAAEEAETQAPKAERNTRRSGRAARDPSLKLGVQTYTWNRVTFSECIDRAQKLGVRYLEGFAWQKISPDAGSAAFNPTAPAEALQKVQQKLKDANIRLTSYYVSDFGKDDASRRKFFEFGKTFGVRQFVCEPDAATLDALEPLCQEYRIRIAIHNHPKNPKKEDYTYWKPEGVLKLIEGRNRFIGCCADTGHWVRSGLDPVECLRKYEGHLFSLHLKDVNEKGAEGHDVPFGQGVSDVKGQLAELARQKFNGLVAIEYEHHMEDNVADVKECLEFVQKTAPAIGTKVASR
jgi:sugar phosphate isomerase/epimerase